jgi:hypothetical protein
MRVSWLVLCAACAARSPAAPVTPVTSDDADEAREVGEEGDDDGAGLDGAGAAGPLVDELRRELGLVRVTVYAHHTVVREAEGRFEVDCSGLVDYALGRAAPDALAELRAATVRRPLAKHYFAFLRGLPPGVRTGRWRPISRVADLAPGDVLAWLRPADVASHNTGHVMVVRAAPVRDRRDPWSFVVPVIDSTAAPHGRTDPRKAARATGVGEGEVVVLVDGDGAPRGYRWTTSARSLRHDTTVAMGRVE